MFIRNQQHKQQRYFLIGMLVLGMLVSGVPYAVGELPDNDTNINLTSRFILWDTNEKMIDNKFSIEITNFNISNNFNFSYRITVNDNVRSGTDQYYHIEDYNINDTDIINNIEIIVNNVSVFNAHNIVIITDFSGNRISPKPYDYSDWINPFTWNRQKWQIFFAVITGSIISILISFRIVKRYRKYKGVKEIK